MLNDMIEYETCKGCRQILESRQFTRLSRDHDRRAPYCNTCAAGKKRTRQATCRARVLAIKTIAGCADCGTHDPEVLEWDHLPGYVKLFGIAQSCAKNRRVLAREMLKCEVVCANCHVKRTAQRRREAAVATMVLPMRSQHRMPAGSLS